MPRLPLADAPETIAYRAVGRVLRNDPVLKNLGLGFFDYSDREGDLIPESVDQMPAITLAPAPVATGWWSEGQHSSDTGVALRLWVAGTDAGDLLNLWHAIRGALWPSDATRRAVVQGIFGMAGVLNGQLARQPFAPIDFEDGTRALAADGLLTLKILVNT